MFKEATIYQITAGEIDLGATAMQAGFTPCGPTQQISYGLVPPRAEHGELIEKIGSHLIMKLCIETKSVPADALARALDARVKRFVEETGISCGKKMRRELKETVMLELLPSAFPKRKMVTLWIDMPRNRLIIGSCITGAIDCALRLMTTLIKDIVLSPLRCNIGFRQYMTHELFDNQSEVFMVGRQAELESDDVDHTKVRYTNHSLLNEDVRNHMRAGRLPTKLQLIGDKSSFVLTESGALRKINVSIPDGGGDIEDVFEADVVLHTSEVRSVIDSLVDDMEGVAE